MNFEIRRAAVEDAAGIGAVKSAVWLGETVDLPHMARVLTGSNRAADVAVCDGVIAGFVDGFSTLAPDGARRWEVDLLAVRPKYRGRGIAARLVSANTDAGRLTGASMARALIQVDNTASQRAFAKAGYQPKGTTCGLYILSDDGAVPGKHEQAQPEGLHAVLVETLRYRGVWLEGELSADGFGYGAWMRRSRGVDVVGAVIPLAETEQVTAAEQAGYALIGYFQWWVVEFP